MYLLCTCTRQVPTTPQGTEKWLSSGFEETEKHGCWSWVPTSGRLGSTDKSEIGSTGVSRFFSLLTAPLLRYEREICVETL